LGIHDTPMPVCEIVANLAFTSSYQIVAFGLVQSQVIALLALAAALPLIAWTLTRVKRTGIESAR
jgi:hypothetical protein